MFRRKTEQKSGPRAGSLFRGAVIPAMVLLVAAATSFSCKERQAHQSAEVPKFEIDKKYERGPIVLSLKINKKEISIADRITLVI